MMQTQTGQTIKWSRKTIIFIDILLVLIPFLLLIGLEIYLRHTNYGLDDRLFIPMRDTQYGLEDRSYIPQSSSLTYQPKYTT